MIYILGLGNNISEKYVNTYHNLGYALCYYILSRASRQYKRIAWKNSDYYKIATIEFINCEITVFVLSSYMNTTGIMLSRFLEENKLYDIIKNNLVCCYDDASVERMMISKSYPKHHNGIRGIVESIGEIYSLRIGFNSRHIPLASVVNTYMSFARRRYYEINMFSVLYDYFDSQSTITIQNMMNYINAVMRYENVEYINTSTGTNRILKSKLLTS